MSQKEKKLKKKAVPLKGNIRWEKLDNTAHLFPAIAGESMTNIYRISVTLKEEIQPDILQDALDIVLPKFDGFNLRLRSGFFWMYFEENGKPAPRVKEESTFPCRFIKPNLNRSYLFSVSYYKNRINLEVFHVLTDGMGGINFLRELTYQYLRLVHPELASEGDALSEQTSLSREDSFVKNYKRSRPSGFKKEKAYLIKKETFPEGYLGLIHGMIPVSQLKEISHRRKVSINEYLVACFMWSVYTECLHQMESKRPIRVAVPVNLRPYFDSVTTKNFFVMVSAEFRPDREDYTFDQVVDIVCTSLREQISKEKLEDLFSYSVSNQKNVFLRAVPLGIKKLAMRAVYNKSATANTTTITNVGNVQIEECYKPYIDLFHAFIPMSKGQSIKGTVVSYGDTLVFTFSSVFVDPSIQRRFFMTVASDGADVKIETNGVYYE